MTAPFFQAVYPFLPFTHGIAAMHACIGGIYGSEYAVQIGQLLLFLVPALLLGLVLRKPVIELNASSRSLRIEDHVGVAAKRTRDVGLGSASRFVHGCGIIKRIQEKGIRMARTGDASVTRRTLHYFWLVTRKHFGLFAALMTATFLFVALLSYGNPYVMSLVVDRVSEGSVAPDQVFAVFGPYILALIAINVAGQAASKVQDYTMYRLEIAASYDLATMSFDALCNQSMSFHSNRFGGTLVSQTTKFMSAYQLLLETVTFPFLPVICSVVFTCAILAPRVPVYVAILMVLLAVYAGVSVFTCTSASYISTRRRQAPRTSFRASCRTRWPTFSR